MPVTLYHCHRSYCSFVKPPFAGTPLNDLISGTSEVARDPSLVSILGKVATRQPIAQQIVVSVIRRSIVRTRLPGIESDCTRTVSISWQRGPGRKRCELYRPAGSR